MHHFLHELAHCKNSEAKKITFVFYFCYNKRVGLLMLRNNNFCFACSELIKRKQHLSSFLLHLIHTNIDIKLFRRPALTSLCSWPGGCSSRGAEQLVGWEWCPNRPSQSARYIWRPRHSLRQKTESITTTTWDSAGREFQVLNFHHKFSLYFIVKTW